MIEFVAPRPKTYPYLDVYSNDHKKAKGIKRSVIKQKLIAWLIVKLYIDHNIDLKVIITMFIQKMLIR